jgi:hypothetical protein
MGETNVVHPSKHWTHGAVFEVRVRANRARASCGVCDWVRTELDDWLAAAALDRGRLFRRVNKVGRARGDGMTVKAVWHILKDTCKPGIVFPFSLEKDIVAHDFLICDDSLVDSGVPKHPSLLRFHRPKIAAALSHVVPDDECCVAFGPHHFSMESASFQTLHTSAPEVLKVRSMQTVVWNFQARRPTRPTSI